MECNKDEAIRAMDIAKRKVTENDYSGAKTFAVKAQNLYPQLDGLKQVLMLIDVYISAGNKINGGEEPDWYGVLGVDPLADDGAVKKQYRKLALLLHPDKNKCEGAEGAFKLILEAWSLLSDKVKRIAYDQKRRVVVMKEVKPRKSRKQKQEPKEPKQTTKKKPPKEPKQPAKKQPPKQPKQPAKKQKQPPKQQEQPTNQQEQPAYQPEQPPKQHEQPSNQQNQPANQQTQPGNRQEPTKQHEQPAYQQEPTNQQERPTKQQEQPANQQKQPAYQQEQPAKQHEQPPKQHEQSPKQQEEPPNQQKQPPSNPQKQQPPNQQKQPPPNQNRQQPSPQKPSQPSSRASRNGRGRSNKPTPKVSTFWTVCNICETQQEYIRVYYLNKKVKCTSCNVSFKAAEIENTNGASRGRDSLSRKASSNMANQTEERVVVEKREDKDEEAARENANSDFKVEERARKKLKTDGSCRGK